LENKQHKSGFVNIIGAPNVGKSTLMNALVGERLSIVTSKAQTTRHRIMGIVSGDHYQIVFSDTPGIIKPSYKLQEKMMNFVASAFQDADLFLVVIDFDNPIQLADEYVERISKQSSPVFVLINKCDTKTEVEIEAKRAEWKLKLPNAEIGAIAALHKVNTDIVLEKIIGFLPEGQPYYDKEQLTDKPERFFVSEIIREKILMLYDAEIPYSCEVLVTAFKEDKPKIVINAEILVERDSQKGIIIGAKGGALKKLGTEARKEMEIFFGKKIFLELFVKVEKDWRSNDSKLKHFGYQA
jgi:GTPase